MTTLRRHALPRALLASAALTAVASCAGEGIVDPVAPPPACTDVAPFRPQFSCIQQLVFTPTCALAGCHAAPGASQGLVLSEGVAYGMLVGVPSTETSTGQIRVSPGDPDNSYLIVKLEGTDSRLVGDRMPFGGPYLSQAEIDVIRQWILDGAPPD